jgi:hypothetical protein
MNTVEPKRKSTSIAHVYELSASGAPADIVKNAADSPRKSQLFLNNSEIQSLEPRQIQMLKRNINVYRRAN